MDQRSWHGGHRGRPSWLGEPQLAGQLHEIREAFPTPEDINDSTRTAPSKRIGSLMSEVGKRYEKPFHGFMAFDEIGLATVRAECPHSDAWVSRLEHRAVEGS